MTSKKQDRPSENAPVPTTREGFEPQIEVEPEPRRDRFRPKPIEGPPLSEIIESRR